MHWIFVKAFYKAWRKSHLSNFEVYSSQKVKHNNISLHLQSSLLGLCLCPPDCPGPERLAGLSLHPGIIRIKGEHVGIPELLRGDRRLEQTPVLGALVHQRHDLVLGQSLLQLLLIILLTLSTVKPVQLLSFLLS